MCLECPKEKRDDVLKEWKKSKDNNNKKPNPKPDADSVKKVDDDEDTDPECTSVIPSGRYVHFDETKDDTRFFSIFQGKVREILCGDGGSIINLLPKDALQKLIDEGADIDVTEFPKPRIFKGPIATDNSGNHLKILCDRMVVIPYIRIDCRHGTWLNLRNSQWMVPVAPANEALLGRPTLKALGLNTSQVMRAAANRYHGDIDFSELVPDVDYEEGTIARIIQDDGIYHSDRGIDCIDDVPHIEIGQDDPEEKSKLKEEQIKKASDNGLSQKGAETLRSIMEDFDDVLRIRLGNEPPAKVEPMQVEVIPSARPIIAKNRRYSKDQRLFISNFVQRLQQYGFVKETKHATWAAAPVIVPKPGPARYRLTFDLRPINAATIPVVWPMPHIDSELMDLADSRCFAQIDFVSGYWQLPLKKSSQTYHGFITHQGTYVPTRVMQGSRNGPVYFQQTVEPCFADIRSRLKAWLDDFLLHARNEEQLLKALLAFLEICRDKGLKVSIKKSTFFALVVKWCGRILDKNGIRFDPRNADGLRNLSTPTTAAELSQFVNCLQWMSQAIPRFSERVQLLRDLVEKAYKCQANVPHVASIDTSLQTMAGRMSIKIHSTN